MDIKSILIPFVLLFIGCSSDDEVGTGSETDSLEIVNDYSYNDLLSLIGEDKLGIAVEKPAANGALGRNRDSYFHVRFQLAMSSVSDFAITTTRTDALEQFVNTVEYSFNHQLDGGNFEFSPPAELLNSPDYQPPSEGDLVSATAFFASSLGIALLSLETSPWYTSSSEAQQFKEEVAMYSLPIEKTLDYLISKQHILLQYDAKAPNRLLFDALAYYCLGKYLERTDAQTVGFEFIEAALDLIDQQQGYFIEGGGWDSSYNGVALKLAMELFTFVEEETMKGNLKGAITRAAEWQLSRIDNSGKISTDGNTRVYPGGEAFLGTEKGVDYAKTVKALYYFGYLTNNPEVIKIGDSVLSYYEQ